VSFVIGRIAAVLVDETTKKASALAEAQLINIMWLIMN
jgi:hypothetical protein